MNAIASLPLAPANTPERFTHVNSPWLQLAALRQSRRRPRFPRLQLRGDRRMLRALRAAEMEAWENPGRNLFQTRSLA